MIADVTLVDNSVQVDADGDGTTDGTPLGATAKLTGTVIIGTAAEALDEITISLSTTTPNYPNFKLRVRPVNGAGPVTRTFNSSTGASAGLNSDGLLNGTNIFGTTEVKVTYDVSIFSTLPGSLPNAMPGTFKGTNASDNIVYTIKITADPCRSGFAGPCGVGQTIEGTYDVVFSAQNTGSAAVSTTTKLTLVRVTTLDVQVTSPTENEGIGSDDLQDLDGDTLKEEILLKGTVNDGGVTSVSLTGGAQLEAALIGSPPADPTGPFGLEVAGDKTAVKSAGATDGEWLAEGLWHVTNEKPSFHANKAYAGTSAFYYGKDPDSTPSSSAFNYATGSSANSGQLRSPKFKITTDATLTFKAWYNTEGGSFWDSKEIYFCPAPFSVGTCTFIAQIVPVPPPGGGFFFPFFGPAAEPGTVYDGSDIGIAATKAVFIPNNFFGPSGSGPVPVEVELDLVEIMGAGIKGTDAHIRFFFNTKDGIYNSFVGLYVDDIQVSGEGATAADAFAVDPVTLKWEGVYKPAEGKNTVNIKGTRTLYNSGLIASTTRNFFLDTVAPKNLKITDPDLLSFTTPNPTTVFVTSASDIALFGTFTEAQPDTLTIEKRTAATTTNPTTAYLNTQFDASTVSTVFTLKNSNNDFDSTGSTTASSTQACLPLVSTKLAAASIAGATSIVVDSTAGFAANDIIKIDVRGKKEYVKVVSVEATIDTLTLADALSSAHEAGAAVGEQLTITVADTTGFEVNKFIKIDEGVLAEVRQITHLDTATSKFALSADLDKSHAEGAEVAGAEDSSYRTENNQNLDLNATFNKFTVTMIDVSGASTTASVIVLRDNTAPTGIAKVVTITSQGEAVVGDQFFLLVAASDGESQVASVTEVATSDELAVVSKVDDLLLDMHSLRVVNSSTTHVSLTTVAAGTPTGENTVTIKIKDTADNEATITATLDVVASRTNRNFFLFTGVNFTGLALIPDDASLDNLMTQDVTSSVDPDFATAKSNNVTLGDVIVTTFAYNASTSVFLVHTPSPSADTLSSLKPFQGIIINTSATSSVSSTTYNVFKKASVTGFSALQDVPIRMNIQGTFIQTGNVLPPSKTLSPGFNLVAPQILTDTTFDIIYRGALIPDQLAVSAIAFDRNVSVIDKGTSIEAEIFEGFVVKSLGDLLKPVLSYWTFIVSGTPTITP